MTTVKWAVQNTMPYIELDVLKAYADYAPKKVLPELLADPARSYAEASLKADYKKCYAFLDYVNNMYQLCAPFDIAIEIDENGRVTGVETPQQVTARAVLFRSEPSSDTNIVLSLAINYVFYSKEVVLVEQIPAFMDYALAMQGVTVIPGTFDISKWVRPLEFAFEIKKGVRSVHIKRGTALCYLRFLPADGSLVKLHEVEESEDMKHVISLCTGLKTVQAKTPLAECYALAKKVVDKFIRPRRCPFRRNKSV